MQKDLNGPNPKNTTKNNKNNNSNNPPKKSTTNKKRKRKHASDKKGSENKAISQLLPKQGVKTPHSSLPVLKIKKVKEPLVTCTYCGKVIENIASAIKPDEDNIYHFDCMLEKLSKEEHLLEGEKISYIGRGTFAIVTKNEENKMVFRKTIEVEKSEAFSQMKKYIEGTKI
jgi:hypothetical protein